MWSTPGMTTIRSRRKIVLVVGAVLAALAILTTAGELSARARIDAALDARIDEAPGIEASAGGGFELWWVAGGHAAIDVAIDDSVLQELILCGTGQDVTVSTTAAGIGASTDLDLRGRSLPVEANLVPRPAGDDWMLVPEWIGIAGLSLPPQRVAEILGDRAPDWLDTGLTLPQPDGISVTSVDLSDGQVRVSVIAPLGADPSGRESPLKSLGCE